MEPELVSGLPLLRARSRLALLGRHRVQLQLDGVLGVVPRVALAPVVADGVREDVAVAREGGRGDAAADLGVALEAVLGVLVPEVECAVGACGAECAVLRVERDGVDRVDLGDVALGGVVLAVAFEREVETVKVLVHIYNLGVRVAYLVSLSSTYWIAQRPSILPTAKPEASVKQLTQRVCHFSGLVMVL